MPGIVFWFFVFPFLLYLILAPIILFLIRKEKRDPQFESKMDKFRASLGKLMPSKRTKEFLVLLLGVVVFILIALSGEPNDP